MGSQMRIAVVTLALVLAPAFIGAAALRAAEHSQAQQQAAIVDVISQQLAAFGRDDAAGAYAFAAPSIQQKFPSPDIFMSMVRRGYAPVYRPVAVEFLELREFQGVPYQAVRLIGPDGAAVIALYRMQQQADGSWRIAGVQLVKPQDEFS